MPDRQKGLSLVEMLIAMTLLALLMTSIVSAVYASLRSYEANERIAAATQAARTVLTRMMREVRTASDVEYTSMSLTIYPPEGDGNPDKIEYRLEGSALTYTRWNGASTGVHTLLGGEGDPVSVSSFYVSGQTGMDQEEPYIKSITVAVNLAVGNEVLPVVASAALRCNQEY